jgi:aminoglycoside phosphotransferase (APT) family kinase protein
MGDKKLEQLVRTWELTGGASAHMTAFELLLNGENRKLILRRPGTRTLERNLNAASEEFRLLQVLHAAGLAVPTPYFLDQSGEIFPTPYLIIEYIEGEPEFTAIPSPDFVRQIAVQLARIHSVDTAKLDFLPQQASGFGEQAPQANPSSDSRRIRAALESIGTLPQLNQPVLRHGDFWPGNLLWKEGHLTAVIDWEDATLGDPLADFAISRLDMLLIFGIEAMQDFTQRYQSLTAFDFTYLPYADLGAALRAAPNLGKWAAGYPSLGRPDITAETMRTAHEWFVSQAFDNLNYRSSEKE